MEGRRVAIIIFYDDKKRILLQERKTISKTKRAKCGEDWGFFGGGIEKGETPEQAVVRETKEELEFNLKDFEYIGNFKNTIKDFFVDRHIFVSSLKDNLSKFVLHEGDQMKLFSISGARKLKMVPGDDGVLDLVDKHLDISE